MSKEFYKEKLIELKSLVEKTEIMIECGIDDLTNLTSFRAHVKRIATSCDKELEKRLNDKITLRYEV